MPQRETMIEVRFHGRGGQGAVVASNLLANAAAIEGNDVQSFPYFGVERRGAPVSAFTKIDNKPIRNKAQIYEPDYVVILDSSLIKAVNVSEGIKENGIIIVNTPLSLEKLNPTWNVNKVRTVTVDATGIAIEYGLGSINQPIVNTSILGAFSRITGLVKIESIVEAIYNMVPRRKEDNVKAARNAYEVTGAPDLRQTKNCQNDYPS